MISRTMMTVFVRFLHTYFVFLLITPYLENEYKIHQITSYDKDAQMKCLSVDVEYHSPAG